jgi:hypothetical protein
LVAARVRADTANRIADAIIACDNDGAEKKPGRRAGLRDAYDIARGFGGAP